MMMTKKKIQRLASALILCLLIISSLFSVGKVLERKDSSHFLASYFLPEYEYDVLLIGSSHVRSGFFPMELWEDYGIRAYNLGADGATVPMAYWILRNALDYHKPEIVVMDIFDLWTGRAVSDYWGFTHMAFDVFPLSLNKIRMVHDLFRDKTLEDKYGNNLYEKRWDLILKFREYHSHWMELTDADFASREQIEEESKVWKGGEPYINLRPRQAPEYPDDLSAIPYDTLSKEYLDRTIELCRDEGIRLILINTGYDCPAESKRFADSVQGIADEAGVPYYDFPALSVIRYETDIASTGDNTHVNVAGAFRQTDYLGKILEQELTGSGTKSDQDMWERDAEAYEASKAGLMRSQSYPVHYAMFLADPGYRTVMEVSDVSAVESVAAKSAFQYLSIGKDFVPETPFWVIPSETGYTCVPFEPGKSQEVETPDGTLIISVQDGKETLLLDGQPLFEDREPAPLRFVVYTENTKKIVDVREFPSE